jgi:tRNA(His) 5'-end guanylyltransferase
VFNNPIQDSASMQTIFFDGRIEKICGILSAKTSVRFNKLIAKYEKFADKLDSDPVFDCRVFSCPSKELLRNAVVWRQMDCRKNAVSMAAHAHFSHKVLQNKNTTEKIEMLFQKGIVMSEYPEQFKNGLFYIRRKKIKPLTDEEIARIPEKHRVNLEQVVRTVYEKHTGVILTKLDEEEIVKFLFDETWASK